MTAIFPGSFDPFTAGHEAIVRRALKLFDKIVIGVGINNSKQGFLTPINRVCLIEDTFKKEPRVTVKIYEELTVEFCRAMRASHIIRGLRNTTDFEFERAIETLGRRIAPEIETIYIFTDMEHLDISSSGVREIHRFGGPTKELLPAGIKLEDYI